METKPLVYRETSSDYDYFAVPIIGTAPLIVAHGLQWDIAGYWEDKPLDIQESKNKIAVLTDDQKATLARLNIKLNGKVPAAAEALLRGHWLPDGRPAFPASGFMGAVRTAVVQHKGKGRDALSARKVSGGFSILGDESYPSLVAIEAEYRTREDTAKSAGIGGAPRLATRIEFAMGWTAVLRVRRVPSLISEQQVAQIIAWSGDYGIGQWRPGAPKGGTFGTYRIDADRELPQS